jgi:pyridoxal phosphate enzyme (YggS family)
MLIGPQNSGSDALLAQRFRELRTQLAAATHAAGRSEDSVTLLAVSKGHDAATLRSAAQLGMMQFGESYVQEALPKIAQLSDLAPEWHFIGRLQANKTAEIAQHFQWVHGVDRLQLAERLAAQRAPQHAAGAPPLNVCLQVNIAGEAQKAGVAPDAVPALARAVHALPGLRLRGLMCIPPAGLDTAATRRHYAALRVLLQQLVTGGLPLDTLSMGMSGDFAAAIAEGATLVRIGTAIFGERQ